MPFNFSQKYFYHIFRFKQDTSQNILRALFELWVGRHTLGVYQEQVFNNLNKNLTVL